MIPKGGSVHRPPPYLDIKKMKYDGLAFIGLSLSRYHTVDGSNCASITRQEAFDFNEIQDRSYKFVASTNDDGWLAGGGESLESYKLPNLDSAHCEIMRIGTFEESLGYNTHTAQLIFNSHYFHDF